MRPLSLVIVEDEPPAARRLQLALVDAPGVEVVGVAEDGASGLEMIRRLRPDVVLLDIKMPSLDGLELAQSLGEDYAPAIIFVTAFANFAVDAFELAAVDFLLKPVRFPRVHEAIERARKRLEDSSAGERAQELQALLKSLRDEGAVAGAEAPPAPGALWITEGRGRTPVAIDTIEWLEAERDYVRIHTGGQSHLIRGSLQSLADRLAPAEFWRVHRSAMVSPRAIKALRPRSWGMTALRLASGAEVPVGRSYVADLKQKLGVRPAAQG
ncbi:MAG TPA: LytTR family DNA-binding domain-containing protein [Caulobacteraceae bacterium]|nr:LytTR family DNA-binding domain-containing protein [Caulobacteraceae bacterium]